ncbi:MAG: PAS domain S-box protein [Balneolaceae bacterium]
MRFADDDFFNSQVLFICDQLSGEILDVNNATLEVLGCKKKDIIGEPITRFANKVIDKNLSSNGNTSTKYEEYWQFKTKKKASYIARFSSHVISFKNKPAKFIIAHDATHEFEQKDKKTAIISKPINFSNFPLAEIVWDAEYDVLLWSKKAEELFGWTEEEVKSSPDLFSEFIHPDDLSMVRQVLSETQTDNKTDVLITHRNLTKLGRSIHCEWYNSLVFDEQGNLISMYSFVQDISYRYEVGRKLKRSMQSYLELFNSISDAIYLLDENGIILEANKGVNNVFGYSPKEVIGQHYKMLSAPGKVDQEQFLSIFKNSSAKSSLKYEGWGRRKSGELFSTEVSVNSGTYFGRKVLIIIEQDISLRKEFESDLKRREVLFSELFNASPIGIALLNNHKEIENINNGFEKIFGYQEHEIKGLELDKLITFEGDYEEAKIISEGKQAKEYIGVRRNKDGTPVDVLIYAVPIFVEGKNIALYGIYVDITDRKNAETIALASLKEKEVLLAEIHHRVKNNLAVITGLLELQSYKTTNEEARGILSESQMRVNSIALVHEKLYQSEDLSEIKIHNYIRELSASIQRAMDSTLKHVAVIFDLDDISLEIKQAIPCGLLLNEILTNSYKHAFKGRDKGKVFISFKEVGGELEFIIRDDGVGFNDEDMANKSKSLGMTLIRILGRQLNAETVITNKKGAYISYTFKKDG